MKKILIVLALALVIPLAFLAPTVSGQGPPPPPPPPGPGPPPPPAPGGATNTPVPIPTNTSVPPTETPIEVPTAVVLKLKLKLAKKQVRPGTKQKLAISTIASGRMNVLLSYPNGMSRSKILIASKKGTASWSYVQPASRITHNSRRARIRVAVTNGVSSKTVSTSYLIGFARLDVSVEPRTRRRGQAMNVWVHTRAFTPIQISLVFANKSKLTSSRRTGGNGWFHLRQTLSPRTPIGAGTARAFSVAKGFSASGQIGFHVAP